MPMSKHQVHAEYCFGDMCVQYILHSETQQMGLRMFPIDKRYRVVEHRADLLELDYIRSLPVEVHDTPAARLEPLVQVKCQGDAYPEGLAQGLSMRHSASVAKLAFAEQSVDRKGDGETVVTVLDSGAGWICKHHLSYRHGSSYLTVHTEFENKGVDEVCLEMLSSFTLGWLTPFDRADAVERLRLHRFRSFWSNEAGLESVLLEDLGLERSWLGFGAVSQRFGQVGSMPVRQYFPFAAIEDCRESVFWGAMLAYQGSWQIEVEKKHDFACLSGGLADREFGHWRKAIAPGETFATPQAILSVSSDSLEDLCDRLVSYQAAPAATPAVEPIPLCFNDWCTFWGDVSHEDITALLPKLAPLPFDYYIIDAGWYKVSGSDWSRSQGDWNYAQDCFPQGMKAIADEIRSHGFKPGIWFEFETVGADSQAIQQHKDHLLHRDGMLLRSGSRAFWDFRDEFAHRYLGEKVIDFLKEGGFEYLKVDYNDSIGMGADGAESQGEGLRQHLAGVERFWQRIRHEMPELYIENCSSGGHRLEPQMMSFCHGGSFSDAHETPTIPIVAANLHRLVLPRKLLVWAVIRQGHDPAAIGYLMAGTFLGVPVLSGDFVDLDGEQIALVGEYLHLYRRVAHLIADGRTHIFAETKPNRLHPRGYQAVLRLNREQSEALLVVHAFAESPTEPVQVALPGGAWRVVEHRSIGIEHQMDSAGGIGLTCRADFASAVIHLRQAD